MVKCDLSHTCTLNPYYQTCFEIESVAMIRYNVVLLQGPDSSCQLQGKATAAGNDLPFSELVQCALVT